MRNFSKKLLFLVIGLSLTGTVWATNGYFSHGTGTRNKSMGGAGAALANGAMSSATNPALLTQVEGGLDAGVGAFNPNRSYSVTNDPPAPNNLFTTASQESDSTLFVIPQVAYARPLSKTAALGVALYARGGMNTDYPQAVFNGGTGATGVDLAQLFLNVTYAIKLGDLSLGVSGILAYQSFEAKGLQGFDNSFMSTNPGYVTNKGASTSNGIGISLGLHYSLGEAFALGFSYTPTTDMSEFEEYKGLFAEGGDFDIPSTYILGVAWKVSPKLQLVLDYQKINYSDVASINNPGPVTNPQVSGPYASEDVKLGGSNGFGFGWEDVTVIKVGAAFTLNDSMTLFGGINKGNQPIPSSQVMFNVLAPGVIENHVTLGFAKALGSGNEISFSYMRALENTVSGNAPAEFGGSNIDLTMDQNEVEVSYRMKL